jgi:hypothetical protein
MRRLAWCACLLGVCIAWATACILIRRSYSPPPEVQTINSFVSYFGQPERVEQIGNDHIVATLSVPSWHLMLNLPSDMPQYVFDRSGKLIDWSVDPGDDPRFQDRWPKARRSSLLFGSGPATQRQR